MCRKHVKTGAHQHRGCQCTPVWFKCIPARAKSHMKPMTAYGRALFTSERERRGRKERSGTEERKIFSCVSSAAVSEVLAPENFAIKAAQIQKREEKY